VYIEVHEDSEHRPSPYHGRAVDFEIGSTESTARPPDTCLSRLVILPGTDNRDGTRCLRGDGVPDKPLRVVVPTHKAGVYAFVCDVFCGDRHEEMSGTIVINE